MVELFEYMLPDLDPRDTVGISIRKANNQRDKAIRLRFRRKDHISRDVLCSVFGKVTQPNARYQGLDIVTSHVHSVKMRIGLF